jgi:hypothetical protein
VANAAVFLGLHNTELYVAFTPQNKSEHKFCIVLLSKWVKKNHPRVASVKGDG